MDLVKEALISRADPDLLKYFESIKQSTNMELRFFKITVEQEDFLYRPLVPLLKAVVSDENALGRMKFDYYSTVVNDMNVYDHPCSTERWKDIVDRLPQFEEPVRVLGVILYSDATTCSNIGGRSEWPIYASLGMLN